MDVYKIDAARCVCFTGHRSFTSDPDTLRLRLQLAILELEARGYRQFLCGMALGFDMLAAQTVLELRRERPLTLTAVMPCSADNYVGHWSDAQLKQLDALLQQADRVITLSQLYEAGCMARRNRFLVTNSSFVLACQEREQGGTWQTVQLAEQLGRPVWNLADGAAGRQSIPALLP